MTDTAENPHIAHAIRLLGSQAKLAEAIGVTQSTLSRLLHGHWRVTAENALAIQRATGGEVTLRDLRSDLAELGEF